ncbi:hypothetical protein C9975_03090 [Thalassospira xiamenensis]|nr:hypothetical protein C9975_03090 [Thalassospira xiamenensis]
MNKEEVEHHTILAYLHAIAAGGFSGGFAWIAPYIASVAILEPPIDLLGLPVMLHAASLVAGVSIGLFCGHQILKVLLSKVE